MPVGTVNDIVDEDVPELESEDGLKVGVGQPEGAVALSAMPALSVPLTVAEIVALPPAPAVTETEVGEAARLKLADWVVLANAAIRPAFGLPQPVTRSYPVTAV